MLFICPSNKLKANGFRLVSQDALAAARGEAFAATADNPSAIHYNPAGISQLEGRQFRFGGYALHFEPTFQPPDGKNNRGKTFGIEENDALAPQLYYTCEIPNTPLTLGLGVYAPHGASVTWPDNTGFRTVAIESELTYLRINPVVSLEIRPGLSFAIGAMIDDASLYSRQGLWEDAISQVFKNNSFEFEGDAMSYGYNLGLLWDINEKWTLGATFRSTNQLKFEGKTIVEYEPFFAGASEHSAKMELEFPYTAVVGISYRPSSRWNIEFNADYTNWSSIDTTLIKQKTAPPAILPNIPVTLSWKDSWILKFGATRYFDEGWYASAGYVFNENSVPTDYYSPIAADLDRHFFTLGIGRQWSRYSVDLAYQYGFAPSRTVTGSTSSSIPAATANQNGDGKYDFESHALLLSFGVKF